MLNEFLRGVTVSILSTSIILLMLFFFTPVLPINILDGNYALISFCAIVVIAFVVYLLLPSEIDNLSQEQWLIPRGQENA